MKSEISDLKSPSPQHAVPPALGIAIGVAFAGLVLYLFWPKPAPPPAATSQTAAVGPAAPQPSPAAAKIKAAHPAWPIEKCELFALHPDWPPRIREAIVGHRIMVGMTPDQVLAVTSISPVETHQAIVGSTESVEWDYPGFGKVLFVGGRVYSIVR